MSSTQHPKKIYTDDGELSLDILHIIEHMGDEYCEYCNDEEIIRAVVNRNFSYSIIEMVINKSSPDTIYIIIDECFKNDAEYIHIFDKYKHRLCSKIYDYVSNDIIDTYEFKKFIIKNIKENPYFIEFLKFFQRYIYTDEFDTTIDSELNYLKNPEFTIQCCDVVLQKVIERCSDDTDYHDNLYDLFESCIDMYLFMGSKDKNNEECYKKSGNYYIDGEYFENYSWYHHPCYESGSYTTKVGLVHARLIFPKDLLNKIKKLKLMGITEPTVAYYEKPYKEIKKSLLERYEISSTYHDVKFVSDAIEVNFNDY